VQDVAFEIFRTYSSIADVVDEARRRPPGPTLPAGHIGASAAAA
jgi:hypothetical protein